MVDEKVTSEEEVKEEALAENNEADEVQNEEEIVNVPLRAMIQALLFVNGEPLSKKRIMEVTSKDEKEVDVVMGEMEEEFSLEESGLKLVKFKQNGEEVFQIRTKPELAPLLSKLKAGRPRRLSKPALETLSIIAYRQPIVKSDIDKIRGVDSAPTIKTLLDRKLISIIGHQASVGQPALYATTDEFLSLFSLESISDLPTLRELKDIDSEPGELPLQ